VKLLGLLCVLIAKETKRMDTKRWLSALCYFSIMFAGILFPLVVYFVSEDQEVKQHAKRALFSHLVPVIPIPLVLYSVYLDVMGGHGDYWMYALLGGILIAVLGIIVLVWNLVKGIKVLT